MKWRQHLGWQQKANTRTTLNVDHRKRKKAKIQNQQMKFTRIQSKCIDIKSSLCHSNSKLWRNHSMYIWWYRSHKRWQKAKGLIITTMAQNKQWMFSSRTKMSAFIEHLNADHRKKKANIQSDVQPTVWIWWAHHFEDQTVKPVVICPIGEPQFTDLWHLYMKDLQNCRRDGI